MPTITSLPYTITVPGTYELDSHLTSPGTAITVACNDVVIDFKGKSIVGPCDPDGNNYGVNAFNYERITIKNGSIRGFMYGIYLSDLIDSFRPHGSFDGGGHVVENMNISNCTFRGMRLEGNGNVIRNNIIREIGGCTVYPNAFGFGIESCGPGVIIENNKVYECRGYGVEDIGEGVAISISDYGQGSVIRDNVLSQSSREPCNQYADWPGASRSTYGIWCGGDTSDIVCDGNVLTNFVYGITFKRTVRGVFTRNVVNNSIVPYYLPNSQCDKQGALARDGGGNYSDVWPNQLLPGRNTPGPTEYLEAHYLAPRGTA